MSTEKRTPQAAARPAHDEFKQAHRDGMAALRAHDIDGFDDAIAREQAATDQFSAAVEETVHLKDPPSDRGSRRVERSRRAG